MKNTQPSNLEMTSLHSDNYKILINNKLQSLIHRNITLTLKILKLRKLNILRLKVPLNNYRKC